MEELIVPGTAELHAGDLNILQLDNKVFELVAVLDRFAACDLAGVNVLATGHGAKQLHRSAVADLGDVKVGIDRLGLLTALSQGKARLIGAAERPADNVDLLFVAGRGLVDRLAVQTLKLEKHVACHLSLLVWWKRPRLDHPDLASGRLCPFVACPAARVQFYLAATGNRDTSRSPISMPSSWKCGRSSKVAE